MVRSPGRFDVYFVCFIFSDLSRSDTPENTTLHASVERRGGRGRRRGEEGGLKKKKKKSQEGMKANKDEGWLSRYVKDNSMRSHLDVEKKEGRGRWQRGKHKAARKTKLLEKFVFLTHGERSVLLQQGDNREKETVEERRRGRAGGQEPTCRLGQKLWLQRGEVRRRGILMTQKPARQVWRGGMPQIPPSSSSKNLRLDNRREGGPLHPGRVKY